MSVMCIIVPINSLQLQSKFDTVWHENLVTRAIKKLPIPSWQGCENNLSARTKGTVKLCHSPSFTRRQEKGLKRRLAKALLHQDHCQSNKYARHQHALDHCLEYDFLLYGSLGSLIQGQVELNRPKHHWMMLVRWLQKYEYIISQKNLQRCEGELLGYFPVNSRKSKPSNALILQQDSGSYVVALADEHATIQGSYQSVQPTCIPPRWCLPPKRLLTPKFWYRLPGHGKQLRRDEEQRATH